MAEIFRDYPEASEIHQLTESFVSNTVTSFIIRKQE